MGRRKQKQQVIDEVDDEEEVLLEEEEESDDDDSDLSDDEDDANAVRLMEDAEGIDDEVRRKLRQEERALGKAIQEETVTYEDGRDKNNELFEKVVYTREAVLDGENLKTLAEKAAKNAENIIQVSSLLTVSTLTLNPSTLCTRNLFLTLFSL